MAPESSIQVKWSYSTKRISTTSKSYLPCCAFSAFFSARYFGQWLFSCLFLLQWKHFPLSAFWTLSLWSVGILSFPLPFLSNATQTIRFAFQQGSRGHFVVKRNLKSIGFYVLKHIVCKQKHILFSIKLLLLFIQ